MPFSILEQRQEGVRYFYSPPPLLHLRDPLFHRCWPNAKMCEVKILRTSVLKKNSLRNAWFVPTENLKIFIYGSRNQQKKENEETLIFCKEMMASSGSKSTGEVLGNSKMFLERVGFVLILASRHSRI